MYMAVLHGFRRVIMQVACTPIMSPYGVNLAAASGDAVPVGSLAISRSLPYPSLAMRGLLKLIQEDSHL